MKCENCEIRVENAVYRSQPGLIARANRRKGEVRISYDRESDKGRKMLILTCLENKVTFYEKMGFTDRGLSGSTWGNEEWHEMTYDLLR